MTAELKEKYIPRIHVTELFDDVGGHESLDYRINQFLRNAEITRKDLIDIKYTSVWDAKRETVCSTALIIYTYPAEDREK